MQIVEVTWLRVIKIWWSLAWRSGLLLIVVGILVGLVLGLLAPVMGLTEGGVEMTAAIVNIFLSILIGVAVLMTLFNTRWSDFRLVLVSLNEDAGAAPPQDNPDQPGPGPIVDDVAPLIDD